MNSREKLPLLCRLNIHTERSYEIVSHPDFNKAVRISKEYGTITRHYCKCGAYQYTWYKATNAQLSWQPTSKKVTTKWYRPYLGEEDPLIPLMS